MEKRKSGKELNNCHAQSYMADGKGDVALLTDFVLVWETCDKNKLTSQAEVIRSNFHKNLRLQTVNLEEEIQETPHRTIHYMKIHIPWELMCKHAEELKLRTPLQVGDQERENKISKCLTSCCNHNAPNTPPAYITCAFKAANIENYLGWQNRDTFFSATQRHQVAYRILATTVYGTTDSGQIGVNRLIEENVYSATYPVNEGSYESTRENRAHPESLSTRQVLYFYWARWGCWYKHQPLDHIRDYYGEKIGLYFAWLGCYTQMLLPVAIVGLLCFIYGVVTVKNDIHIQETCNHEQAILMCPFCEEKEGCQYWYLESLCFYRTIGFLFDNNGAVFFAIFIVAWAVIFLELWKRRCSKLTYRWDVFDYEREEEALRPQFLSICTDFGQSPITGQLEPVFSSSVRKSRIFFGFVVSMFMLCIVLSFLIAVIIYRGVVLAPMFLNPTIQSKANLFASGTGALINLILILTLGRIYEIIAYKMTHWEMHETQSQFDKFYTVKVFLFQFVNYYASIFYIAFFKGKFVGRPGAFMKFLGIPNEACSAGGCMVELAQQFIVIMVGKQIISNFQEIFLPMITSWFHVQSSELKKTRKKKMKDGIEQSPIGILKQFMEDYRLVENTGLFSEYLEMVIQFGFITIFAAAFPLAPLFALVNNWMEIRIDAQKLVCATRRPISERARSIGIWMQILEILVGIAIICNAFMIAFTADFLPKALYKYTVNETMHGYTQFLLVDAVANSTRLPCKYEDFRNPDGEFTTFYWQLFILRFFFVILFEHIAFCVSYCLRLLIPDIPENVDIALRREKYLSKQAILGMVVVTNILILVNKAHFHMHFKFYINANIVIRKFIITSICYLANSST